MSVNRTPNWWPALALLGLTGTGSSPARADGPQVVTYREVKTILKSQCFKCHSPEEKRARLDMTTYGALMRGSTSGPVVVKGNPTRACSTWWSRTRKNRGCRRARRKCPTTASS
jgi:hypothetical protein